MTARPIVKTLILDQDPVVKAWMNKHPYILADDDEDVDEIDLSDYHMIVYTGGEDVHPRFYGQEPITKVHTYDVERDLRELDIFTRTRDSHYHFGICRGLQLLAVAHKYPLWQHITGHMLQGSHGLVCKHGEYAGKIIEGVSSSHHQAVMCWDDSLGGKVMAVENFGQQISAKSSAYDAEILDVVESMWFKSTNTFGVQGHPEYVTASAEYEQYVWHHLLDDDETGYFNQVFEPYSPLKGD